MSIGHVTSQKVIHNNLINMNLGTSINRDTIWVNIEKK